MTLQQIQLDGRHFLGAERSRESTDDGFRAVDPTSGSALEPAFVDATLNEVNRAVSKAAEAFPAFDAAGRETRAKLLEAIADNLEDLGDLLLDRAAAETALPAATRLQSERGRTCGQLRLFAEVLREGSFVGARIDHGDPERAPIPKPDVRRMLVPLGPVAIFGASNFPLAFSVAGGDTASALAAGCPVVAKGHPGHPGTSELVAAAIADALRTVGLPDGAFSLRPGRQPRGGHGAGDPPGDPRRRLHRLARAADAPSSTPRRAGRSRFRSTPRWAPRIRSSCCRARWPTTPTRLRQGSPARYASASDSSAPIRAWSSSWKAKRPAPW